MKVAAAAVLERGAELLDEPGSGPGGAAGRARRAARRAARDGARRDRRCCPRGRWRPAPPSRRSSWSAALDPSFRAQELSFVVSQIGGNIEAVAAAERRSWLARLLGREPAARAGHAGRRAGARRGARRAALGVAAQQPARRRSASALAVLVAELTGVAALVLGRPRHALGAALERAQHRPERAARAARHGRRVRRRRACSLRSIGAEHDGAVAAAAAGGAVRRLRAGGGLVRGRAGAFTLTLVILYNIVAAGGLAGRARADRGRRDRLRGQPRGRAAVLAARRRRGARRGARRGLRGQRRYLAAAVAFGMGRCDARRAGAGAPDAEASRAAAAARAARRHLPQLSRRARRQARCRSPRSPSLVTGVAGPAPRRRRGARSLASATTAAPAATGPPRARSWSSQRADLVPAGTSGFAASLTGRGAVPEPLPATPVADGGCSTRCAATCAARTAAPARPPCG